MAKNNKDRAIIDAVKMGDIEKVSKLVKTLYDVNICDKDNCCASLLSYATENGDIDMMNYLLDCGASVDDADTNGMTSLSFAVENDDKDAAELLLGNGADPNIDLSVIKNVSRNMMDILIKYERED